MQLKKLSRLFFLSGTMLTLLQLTSCREDKDESIYRPPHTLQVWLHHVDHIDKAQRFQYSYSGFELDVHFDTTVGTFLVKHDFEDTTHLLFSTWLSAIDNPGRLGYWLDFKNLSYEFKFKARDELLRLRKQFNLTRHTIVVEACDPDNLTPFDTLNFRPSFYLPTFDPDTLNEEEEMSYKNWIDGFSATDIIKTISAYYFQHSFMQKWYPKKSKLLWYLDSYDPVIRDSIVSLVKQDTTVEVLLLSENYPGEKELVINSMKSLKSKYKLIK